MNSELMMVNAAREYLKRADGPVSLYELMEKTGVTQDQVASLERNHVLNSWAQAAGKTIPIDDFINWFGSTIVSQAEKLAKYLTTTPKKLIRKDEISAVLGIDRETVYYILSRLTTARLVIPFYTLVPIGNCDLCFYREKCNRDKPAERCGLFNYDYRLEGQREVS